MGKIKDSPSLSQVFLHLVLFRLFLPIMLLILMVIAGIGYLGQQNLVNQQKQVVQSVSHIVDYHIDSGERTLSAIAQIAETTGTDNLLTFMKSTWQTYGYFETLYYLDESNRIILLMPSDPRYAGLDMSNLPDFKKDQDKKNISISRPFISLRTGEPTVYLVKFLSKGGCVIGALNLGMFQEEIMNISKSGKNFVFIMDESGTLLAHPSQDLVKQQDNLSDLGIYQSMLHGKNNDLYIYNGSRVIGSVERVKKAGWVVVDQLPLSDFGKSYAWTWGLSFSFSLIILLTLIWGLRKQIHKYVITPMQTLSRGTNALTIGNFSHANFLESIPIAFSELNKLAEDFQFMSNNLKARETALKNAHDELEIKVQKRTQELSSVNEELTSMYENLQQTNFDLHKEIVERKRAEEELAQKKQEIEDAYLELKNAQLQIIQQEKMASIGQLAAGVAHEINNPLGFIMSNIDSLKKYAENITKFIISEEEFLKELDKNEEEKNKSIEIFKIINKSEEIKQEFKIDYIMEDITEIIVETLDGAERIRDIVQNLRNFSRTSIKTSLADINKGLESVIKIIWNEIKYKATLKKEFGNIPLTNCNEGQLNQVFLNILLNAVQAIEEKGEIEIKTWADEKNIFTSITDNGCGIPKEIQNRIFEPFFTTKDVGKGTGLGLSVSYDIIKKHKGDISIESTPDIGTTFVVKIPIVE